MGSNAVKNGTACSSRVQWVMHIHNVGAEEAVKTCGVYSHAGCVCVHIRVCVPGGVVRRAAVGPSEKGQHRAQLMGSCPL